MTDSFCFLLGLFRGYAVENQMPDWRAEALLTNGSAVFAKMERVVCGIGLVRRSIRLSARKSDGLKQSARCGAGVPIGEPKRCKRCCAGVGATVCRLCG